MEVLSRERLCRGVSLANHGVWLGCLDISKDSSVRRTIVLPTLNSSGNCLPLVLYYITQPILFYAAHLMQTVRRSLSLRSI
ncbi:hypothetical protein P691DRAFT_42845 [Macrolepiota fuliginosa MF-IS2]|uniref:Uncharacterized protein n=1 Tax=Macrolepiota fuliginosa MF-IS2 TaxID=1400762 RepID=A0A9P6C6B8_9AGAR|nr:hypothetical protein P691DRAFT_42845 [Macrolepiota fuliginosa MF-IS2]